MGRIYIVEVYINDEKNDQLIFATKKAALKYCSYYKGLGSIYCILEQWDADISGMFRHSKVLIDKHNSNETNETTTPKDKS